MIRRPPRSTLFPYTTALPICSGLPGYAGRRPGPARQRRHHHHPVVPVREIHVRRRPHPTVDVPAPVDRHRRPHRSEEHTSELQSQSNLVCRLLLEKKKNNNYSFALWQTYKTTQRITILRL